MAGSGKVTLAWADGRYTFGLQIGDLVELWENPLIKAGPVALYHRIKKDEGGPLDVPEVIRLALIRGSKVPPLKAMNLMDRYYYEANKIDGKEIALRILAAYLLWPEDDPVGKRKAAGEVNGHPAPPLNSSPSQPSTPPVSN